MNVNKMVEDFGAWYGDGKDGASPTGEQWRRVLGRPAESPVTLINFIKLRSKADYKSGDEVDGATGEAAFSKYSAVSVPTMARVGGEFLFVGPYQGMFVGEEEDWDLIAIGAYPNLAALVGLFSDEQYRAVFHHRSAACERQKVVLCAA